jgi:hypothetical protein
MCYSQVFSLRGRGSPAKAELHKASCGGSRKLPTCPSIFSFRALRGLVVAAVDGIEICSSFVRCCDAYMEREIEHKVNGEMRTDIQYYHRIVVDAVVSTPFPIPLFAFRRRAKER